MKKEERTLEELDEMIMRSEARLERLETLGAPSILIEKEREWHFKLNQRWLRKVILDSVKKERAREM